jgi:hypothetical protein
MTATLLNETRIGLTKLANEQGVAPATVWRWATRGIRGHVLETFSLGAKKLTTREAFLRWIAATNGEKVDSGQTPRDREQSITTAERELESMGV